MIIKLENEKERTELEVLIRYNEKLHKVKKIEQMLRSVDCKIPCNKEKKEFWVAGADIYYIESVDKHSFVYCENEVYETELRLYQLEEELAAFGFVRISKSCLVNIQVLQSIKPLLNSRLEAVLINGEKLTVTRKYIHAIRAALEGH